MPGATDANSSGGGSTWRAAAATAALSSSGKAPSMTQMSAPIFLSTEAAPAESSAREKFDRHGCHRRAFLPKFALRGDGRDDQHPQRNEITGHVSALRGPATAGEWWLDRSLQLWRSIAIPQEFFCLKRLGKTAFLRGIALTGGCPRLTSSGQGFQKTNALADAGAVKLPSHITLWPRTIVPTGQPVTVMP